MDILSHPIAEIEQFEILAQNGPILGVREQNPDFPPNRREFSRIIFPINYLYYEDHLGRFWSSFAILLLDGFYYGSLRASVKVRFLKDTERKTE